ncbi:hypothetical protein ACFLT7_05775 [candidate division KSB1 bacterium]
MAVESVTAATAVEVQNVNGNEPADQAENEPDAGAEEVDQVATDENVGGQVDIQA